MKRLSELLLVGLLTLLPLALLVYLLAYIVLGSEFLIGAWMATLLPAGWYVPGMGLAAGLLLILFTGLVARSWIGPPLGRWLSARIASLPYLGRLFLILRDIVRRLGSDRRGGFEKVVFVADANGRGRLGLIADPTPLRISETHTGLLAVYFPGSFETGGQLELIPAKQVEQTDLSVEAAFRLLFTGGLSRADHDTNNTGRG